MKIKHFILVLFLSVSIISCNDDEINSISVDEIINSVFEQGTRLPYELLTTLDDGTEVRNGGYGSAAVKHPTKENMFYALTDRGPNVSYTGAEGSGKKFPVPTYSPRVGLFRLNDDGSITQEKTIILKNPAGIPITGLPNPLGKGATGEIPYDINGNKIGTDDYGLDGEGLAFQNDGTFWVSDEYGPHIVHFDANGVQLERVSPVGINDNTGDRKLPAVFARRRANRGMEGLAITPDNKTLVGIMQSTMNNPTGAAKNNNVIRIVTFDIETGATKQYLYKQEKNQNSNSEITAISSTEFLVIERDGKFLAEDATAQKQIYKINISGATDIGVQNGKDLFNDVNGYMIGDKTIEQSTASEIESAGVKFVTKTLVADLVQLVNYPHDKMEGIWLISDSKLGILNDDDFAVWESSGNVVPKTLPPSNPNAEIDGNSLYIINY
ncbi:MAG: esterase-like activity of phytase family protein [Flavobacteriales bacterium]|nr:esterase-like activity of phytase family protein [Flavobacteriales bacterium]